MFVEKGLFNKSLLAMTLSVCCFQSLHAQEWMEKRYYPANIQEALTTLHISTDSYLSFSEIDPIAKKLIIDSYKNHAPGFPQNGKWEEAHRYINYTDALLYISNNKHLLPIRPENEQDLLPHQKVEPESTDDQPTLIPKNIATQIILKSINSTASFATATQAKTLFASGLNEAVLATSTNSMSQHGAAVTGFRTGRLLSQTKLQDFESGEMLVSTDPVSTNTSLVREGGVYSYGQIYGFKLNQNQVDDLTGFDANGYGLEVGILKQFTAEWSAGIMVGIQKMDSSFKNATGSLSTRNFRAGPFVAWDHESWHLNAALTYGMTDINNKRTDMLDGTEYKSTPKSTEWTAYASAGYDFSLDNLITGLTLTPNIELIYIHNTVDSFKEKGNGKRALKVDKQNHQGWITRTGLNLTWLLPNVESSKQLRAGVGYQKSFLEDSDISVGFVEQAGIQNLKAGNYGRDSVYYNLGYSQNMNSDQNIHIDYFGSTGNKSQSHAVALTYEMKF